MWVAFATLVPLTGVLAILDRHQNLPYTKPYWPDVVRALGSSAVFAGLALLIPPGSTCLLPGPTPGSSLLPDYAPQVFVVVVYAISSVLGKYGKELRANPAWSLNSEGRTGGTGGTVGTSGSGSASATEPLLGPSTPSHADVA
jgi:hypothetical protein